MLFFILVICIVVFLYLWFKKKLATDPWKGPLPPVVDGTIPFIGAGLEWLGNPRVRKLSFCFFSSFNF